MGVLRNRVVPLHQTAVARQSPKEKGISFLLTLHGCRHQEREDQERANP